MMDRLDEIRAAYEEQKRYGSSGFMMRMDDIGYLLAEIERLKTQCDINATSFFDMWNQFKKAEADRDTYRAALQLLELMISGEREGSKEREHSVGVVIAVNRARELMKGE